MENIFLGMQKCIANDKCEWVSISNIFIESMGYSLEEIKGEFQNSFYALVVPEDVEWIQAERRKQVQKNNKFSLCYRICKKSGEPVWVFEEGYFCMEKGIEYVLFQNFRVDYAVKCERFYHELINTLPSPIVVLDNQMKVVFLNKEGEKTLGCTLENCIGRHCSVFATGICGTSNCCIQKFERGEEFSIQHSSDGRAMRVCCARLYGVSREKVGYICIYMDITELIKTQKQLQKSEERCKIALSQMCNAIWEYDFEKGTIYKADFHTGLLENGSMTSGGLETLTEVLCKKELIDQLSYEDLKQFYREIRKGKEGSECIIKIKDDIGIVHWVKFGYNSILNKEGKPLRAIGVARDVTSEKIMLDNFQRELQYRDAISYDALSTYEIDISKNKIIWRDDSVWGPLERMKDESYHSLLDRAKYRYVYADDRILFQERLDREHLLAEFRKGKREIHVEYRRKSPQNTVVWVCCSVYLIQAVSNGHICGFFTVKDIDIQKKKEQKLRIQAERDPLTGLYNRIAVLSMIERELENTQQTAALMMLDIDHFKQVNDTYGHLYGDAVLSETARKIQSVVPKGQILGRIGGDEFMIFLCMPSQKMILDKAQEICETLHTDFSSNNTKCEISVSMGIVFVPREGNSFSNLYEKADIALYEAKERGRNRYCIYRKEWKVDSSEPKREEKQIEENIGKTFTENISEYIFKILYHTKDVELAISPVLELICRHYNAQHGYLYEYNKEEKTFAMTFEWCNKDVESLLQTEIALNQEDCRKLFGQQKVMLIEDMQEYPIDKKIYIHAGSKAMMRSAIFVDEEYKGFVGVDFHEGAKLLTDKDKDDIVTITEIIGTFLHAKRVQQARANYTYILQTIMDHIESASYVVDPEEHKLIFLSQKMCSLFPKAYVGGSCYQCIRNYDKPCPDCAMLHLEEHMGAQKAITVYNKEKDCHMKIWVKWVRWTDGKKYCLVHCIDVTEKDEA